MKPLVYISGPINGSDVYEVYHNLAAFFEAEKELLKSGFAPINPAADFIALMMMGERMGREDWRRMLMGKDEPLVKGADAIFMLPGWTHSPGAREEWEWAKDFGVPAFCTFASLTNCFRKGRL